MKSPDARTPLETLVEFDSLIDRKIIKFLHESLGAEDASEAISEARSCFEELTGEHDRFRMSYTDVKSASEALYTKLVETCGRNDGIFKHRKVERVTLILVYHISLLYRIFTKPR